MLHANMNKEISKYLKDEAFAGLQMNDYCDSGSIQCKMCQRGFETFYD